MPRPDFLVRLAIARQYMRPVAAPEPHMTILAWITHGASGAEVEALVRAYKKELAVNPDGQKEILMLLRRFAMLNTGRIDEQRKSLLSGSEEELLQALRDDTGLPLEELGAITGQDKSTISRRLKRGASKEQN